MVFGFAFQQGDPAGSRTDRQQAAGSLTTPHHGFGPPSLHPGISLEGRWWHGIISISIRERERGKAGAGANRMIRRKEKKKGAGHVISISISIYLSIWGRKRKEETAGGSRNIQDWIIIIQNPNNPFINNNK